MQLQTKTKILAWAVVGDKEKIDFDLCDFSPDQVAQLDRLIRAEGDNKVRIEIAPEQKKLQIEPITSTVRLVSLACRTKGQKIKVGDFKSPDERAMAIKRMSAADTPIFLSISEIQTTMLTDSKKQAESATRTPTAEPDAPHTERIEIKCKGMKLAKFTAYLRCDGPGEWRFGWDIQMGNYIHTASDEDCAGFDCRHAALNGLLLAAGTWLESIELPAGADQQRALKARQKSMIEQIKEKIGDLIRQGKDEVPFEEDPPWEEVESEEDAEEEDE